MHKLIHPLLILLLAVGSQQIKAESIEFIHDWEEALTAANEQDKPIFLDAYTTWCGPCKWMAANVFTDENVAKFYNANFINVKLDMERGDGLELAKMYGVQAYPSLLFFNESGKITHRVAGVRVGQDFIDLGKAAMETQEPLHEMYAKIEAGNYDRDLLFKYVLHGNEVSMDVAKEAKELKEGLEPKEILTESGWAFFYSQMYSVEDEFWAFFLKNRAEIEEKFGKDKAEKKYYINHVVSYEKAIRASDAKQVEALAKVFEDNKAPEEMMGYYYGLTLTWIEQEEGLEAGYRTLHEWVQEGRYADANTLNNKAWEVYETKEIDPEYVEMAIVWTEKAMETDRSSAVVDTYAMLLYKNGELDRAIEAAEESIALAKESGEDASATEKALEKMKKER